MITTGLFGIIPWEVVTAALGAAATWGTAAWHYRRRTKTNFINRGERLEIHRDELTFELLQNARQEMADARIEVDDLRDEVRKLRSMELHFYHFQQSLDHLEALLFAETQELRVAAERNARAFLTRMQRFNEAKGIFANETQRAASGVEIAGRKVDEAGKDLGNG